MDSPDTIIYTARVMSTGGRQGRVISADGVLDLQLSTPGRPGVEGTNPEELFGAALASCFNAALVDIADSVGFDASGCTVKARVHLGLHEGWGAISVELLVAIPGEALDDVQRLADAATEACVYAKAIRGNVPFTVIAVEG